MLALVVPGQNSSSWIPARAAVRSAPLRLSRPALSSQNYTCTTSQRKSLRVPRRRTRRRTCRSSLSRPSGSVRPVLPSLQCNENPRSVPAPPYAPSHVPQSALAPLRLCPPSTIYFHETPHQRPAPSHVPQLALAPLRRCLPVLGWSVLVASR